VLCVLKWSMHTSRKAERSEPSHKEEEEKRTVRMAKRRATKSRPSILLLVVVGMLSERAALSLQLPQRTRRISPIRMASANARLAPKWLHQREQLLKRDWSLLASVSTDHNDGNTTSQHQQPIRLLHHVLPPAIQFALVLFFYTLHLNFCTPRQITFPIQWWYGSKYRNFTGLGYDSIVGMASLGVFLFIRRRPQNQQLPWKFPKSKPTSWFYPENSSATANISISSPAISRSPAMQLLHENWPHILHRGTFLTSFSLLVSAYFATGRLSLFWEDLLYSMSATGWPLNAPQFRAWTVLLGHLSWVAVGTVILALLPRAPRFFSSSSPMNSLASTWSTKNSTAAVQGTPSKPVPDDASSTNPWHWFRFNICQCNWWSWVLGGYFVSSWLFNLADWANQVILPVEVLQQSAESVVSLLVAPEHNDVTASIVGYIAPCLTAPVWEEVLYRGFLLAGLQHWTGNLHLAAVLQAVVFSAHHMSVSAALPLFVLGWTWAGLYVASGNLWTVCAVHALWNSRVFLGSWLGL
jgi:membrane protease YdiL (CAAX protease family)